MSETSDHGNQPVAAQDMPRRETILAESARLFNENGYHDTRLSDVADRLGLVKTTISYHFRSKEALLHQLYEEACARTEADLAEALLQPTGRDAISHWLRRNCHREIEALDRHTAPLAIIGDLNALADRERSAIGLRLQAHVNTVREMVDRGQIDGSLSVRSVEAVTAFFLGVRRWLRDTLVSVQGVDRPEAVLHLQSLLLEGLSAEPDWQPRRLPPPDRTDELSLVFDRETRSRLKREAFLRTGTRMLNERGFRNLSLLDVAGELGVSRSAFYYYIADRDALLQQCVDRSLETLEAALAFAMQGQMDSLSRLWNVLHHVVGGHSSNLDPLIRLNLLNALPEAQRAVARARYRRIAAGFGQIIADGMVDGSIRPVRVSGVEQIITGALFAMGREECKFALKEMTRSFDRAEVSPLSMAYFDPIFRGISRSRQETRIDQISKV